MCLSYVGAVYVEVVVCRRCLCVCVVTVQIILCGRTMCGYNFVCVAQHVEVHPIDLVRVHAVRIPGSNSSRVPFVRPEFTPRT